MGQNADSVSRFVFKSMGTSPPSSHPRPALTDAIAGGVAGAVARLVVGPLDVLKIRFQVQLEPVARGAPASKYTGLAQAVTTIVREEGLAVSRGRRWFDQHKTGRTHMPERQPPLFQPLHHHRASGEAPCPASCSPCPTPPSSL